MSESSVYTSNSVVPISFFNQISDVVIMTSALLRLFNGMTLMPRLLLYASNSIPLAYLDSNSQHLWHQSLYFTSPLPTMNLMRLISLNSNLLHSTLFSFLPLLKRILLALLCQLTTPVRFLPFYLNSHLIVQFR